MLYPDLTHLFWFMTLKRLSSNLLTFMKTFIFIIKVTTDLCSVVDMIWVVSITLDLVQTLINVIWLTALLYNSALKVTCRLKKINLGTIKINLKSNLTCNIYTCSKVRCWYPQINDNINSISLHVNSSKDTYLF